MPCLSAQQLRYVKRLLDVALRDEQGKPSVLLIGPKGVGKQTIAQEAAAQLGSSFILCDVANIARGLSALIYLPSQDELAGYPSMVYLVGVERVADASVIADVEELTSNRTFIDVRGGRQELPADCWIVGSLSLDTDGASIGPDHSLCTYFDSRVSVDPVSDRTEILSICQSLMHEFGGQRELDVGICDLLVAHSYPQVDLDKIRGWIENAYLATEPGSTIDTAHVRKCIHDDTSYLCRRIDYRGCALDPARLLAWLAQFPDDIEHLALRLFRNIAERYYIRSSDYFRGLQELIVRSGIPPRARVSFCRWQPLGSSGEHVAHDLKNQAAWQIDDDIALGAPPRAWPMRGNDSVKWIVIADDFVGSGDTISKLWSEQDVGIPALLDAYPRASVRILVVAGFLANLRTISVPDTLAARVRFHHYRHFYEEDMCFHERSRILPGFEERTCLRDFCVSTAHTCYPAARRMALGYGDVGALVVFPSTVPNNTLPIIWYDRSEQWTPLFPASGLLAASPDHS